MWAIVLVSLFLVASILEKIMALLILLLVACRVGVEIILDVLALSLVLEIVHMSSTHKQKCP